MHIGDDAFYFVFDTRKLGCVGDAIDFEMCERLDHNDGISVVRELAELR